LNHAQKLVEFIPTETIILFWLAIPASKSLATWLAEQSKAVPPSPPTNIDWWVFGGLVALTPVLFLLSFLNRMAVAKLPRPTWRAWPWWKAVAATVAFTCWAFAVPGNPFVTAPALLMCIWFGATLVSTLLGLIDPIIDPQ
jgi:quinol-cytochrome oxidoreductase complex cytochrome b subunit